MSTEEFLIAFKNLIQSNSNIDLNSNLSEIAEYDSLSKLVLMAYLNDNFKIKISAQEITSLQTVNDIFKVINNAA